MYTEVHTPVGIPCSSMEIEAAPILETQTSQILETEVAAFAAGTIIALLQEAALELRMETPLTTVGPHLHVLFSIPDY